VFGSGEEFVAITQQRGRRLMAQTGCMPKAGGAEESVTPFATAAPQPGHHGTRDRVAEPAGAAGTRLLVQAARKIHDQACGQVKPRLDGIDQHIFAVVRMCAKGQQAEAFQHGIAVVQ